MEKKIGLALVAVSLGAAVFVAGNSKPPETPGCVRAPCDGSGDCRRLIAGKPVNFGACNRFPTSEAIGTGCEPVSCSVRSGEDADK